MADNALDLLRKDHEKVEDLFKRFEEAGPNAVKTKADILSRVVEELSVHTSVEEELLYPFALDRVPETEDTVRESLEEHHLVKVAMAELEAIDPEDERFDAKMTVLMENVRHHVEEEEEDLFPEIDDAVDDDDLEQLGSRLAEAKKTAPTKPEPDLSDLKK